MAGNESRRILAMLSALPEVERTELHDKLLQHICDAMPFGRHPAYYIEEIPDASTRLHLRSSIELLNHIKLRTDWQSILPQPDLEKGVFLISRFSDDYGLHYGEFTSALDEMAKQIGESIQDQHGVEKLRLFLKAIFDDLGFAGNVEHYYDPMNSFLTHVISTKRGIPVSLSVLCILLGQRLGIRLTGINLPGHFLLRYDGDEDGVYVDPFNQGNLLSTEDCLNFLTKHSLPAKGLAQAGPLSIVQRMYRNLIHYYGSIGNRKMKDLLQSHNEMFLKASRVSQ